MLLEHLLLAAGLAFAPQDTAHVVVVGTAEVRGRATDWDYAEDGPYPGGLVRAATIVDSLRQRHPDQVVLVDAGDALQGDAFAAFFGRVEPRDPHPIVDLMGAIGYDAATLGVHDFDFGVAALRRALAGAAFPYVSANLRSLPTDTLLLQPHVVVRRGPVRVGVVGFTAPDPTSPGPDRLEGRVRLAPVRPAADAAIRRLRGESDLVIALAHGGIDPETFAGSPTDRPDLVVLGHAHRVVGDTVIGGVRWVQPPGQARGVAVVHLTLAWKDGRWRPVEVRAELVPLAGVPASPRVQRRLAAAHERARGWAARPVGVLRAPMSAVTARIEPTALTGFVTEVLRARAGADLAATAVHSPRGLDEGEVTLGRLFAAYPEEHSLRAIRVSGAQLVRFLERSASVYQLDSAGHARLDPDLPARAHEILSGAEYVIDLRLPPGRRIRDLRVRGRPVTERDTFTLALAGPRRLGESDPVGGATVVYDRGESVRELLAAELRRRGEVDPGEFHRPNWRIVPDEAARSLLARYAPERVAPKPAPQDTLLLRILVTGGLPASLDGTPELAAALDSAEAGCRCPTLRLDAGPLESGARIGVEALNHLRIAARAVGPEETEWPTDTVLRRMAESRFRWLGANLLDPSTGRRPDWAVPFHVVPAGSLRLGVIGYVRAGEGSAARPAGTTRLPVVRGLRGIEEALRELSARRPDLVVLLTQAPANCERGGCGELVELATTLAPGSVDLVVAGPGAGPTGTILAGVPVVQPGPGGGTVGMVDLVRTAVGERELRVRIDTVRAAWVSPDSALAALVERHRRAGKTIAAQVVARLERPLVRRGPQHPLGNLVADAQRNALRTDFALVAGSSIAADLPAGSVTLGRLAEVHPTTRRLLRTTVTGEELRRVLEEVVA
ncbi:MAG TPA: 5'-nucleotidase C-terminal domain-containing protein, partial [Gemmatimonadales bacterium]|nr:5'-nucleotidase C-terminal domain-containing protein [Gemmatimonadales bacterium]